MGAAQLPQGIYTADMTSLRSVLSALGFALLLCAGFFIAVPRVHATGTAADSMCTPVYTQCPCHQDPDPTTGKCMPGGQNKFMCPPGPEICKDETNGHVTTGTCDRPNHCLTNTCGGKECKQVKPGQQQQPQDQGQGQKGQDQGQGGQPPQMPKPPQGGGGSGDKPQPQDQQNSGNCAFSSALGIPCTPAVSSQLGSGSSGGNPDAAQALEKLQALGNQGDASAAAGSSGGSPADSSAAPPQSLGQHINSAISDFFRGLVGSQPNSNDTPGNAQPNQFENPNATGFSAPAASPAAPPAFFGRAVSWLASLFGR